MNEKKFHFEYHCWILNCFCSKLLSKIRKKKPIHCEILHVVEPEHINRQMINQTSANDLHKKHILGLKVDKLMLSLITSKPRHRKECQYKYSYVKRLLKCLFYFVFILNVSPVFTVYLYRCKSLIYMYTCEVTTRLNEHTNSGVVADTYK